jgi:hypothetical protein
MGATFPLTFPATFEPQPSWWIDGEAITRQVDETATPRGLSLSWRVTSDLLESKLRPLKQDEGKVDVIGTDSGGHRAIDRANGSNTYVLTPPDKRQPLRQEATYHVDQFEETLISQDVGEWQVDVEFVRARDRTDDASVNQPVGGATFDAAFPMTFERRSPAGWGFTTPNGEFWTDRVSAELLGTGEGGVRRFELTMRLTFEEARAFETAYPRIGGGRVREVPDAPNVAVDDTTDGAVTIGVDAPGTNDVPDGEYVITEPWESTRLTEAYQEVSVVIAAKD